MEWIVRFELPSGGPGPDTVESDAVAAEFDAMVVLLLREHYCQASRDRARAYSDASDRFRDRDVAVIAALPDERRRAAFWRDRYDLRYPVVADTATDVDTNAERGATAMTDGTPRFDAFAEVEARLDSLASACSTRPAGCRASSTPKAGSASRTARAPTRR